MDWQQALDTWPQWRLPSLNNSEPAVIDSISRGNNQHSLIVKVGNLLCAMRLRHIDSQRIGLDWQDEVKAQTHAAGLNISPAIYFCSEELLVTEYIEGNHKPNLSNHDLQQLACTLYQLHNQEFELSTLDLAEKADFYWQQMKAQQKAECKHIHNDLLEVLKSENPFSKSLHPCHNDLNPGNIIFYYKTDKNSSDLMLIDWEYAALGNPLFDLAGVIRNWDLSLEEGNTFLRYYFQQDNSQPDYKNALNQALIACDYLSYLWYILYEPDSPHIYKLRQRLL